VHLITKRVSANPMNLGSNYRGFSVSSFNYASNSADLSLDVDYLNDTINQIHDTCYCVPSENTEYVYSFVLYDSKKTQYALKFGKLYNSMDTIITGYNDTINLSIQY
jgi:hypothetical protein